MSSENIMDINSPMVSLSVSTTSSRVALGTPSSDFIIVKNEGTDTAYVVTGDSTVVSTTSKTAILSGEVSSYRKQYPHTHLAGITASGTATLRIQVGGGI